MQLFYTDDIDGDHALLTEQEAVHCAKVLRHQIGDQIHLLDGKGSLYLMGIVQIKKKEVSLQKIEVIESQESPAPLPSVAVGLIKNNNRFEWFVEKAVEIGVREIIPLICDRSERPKLNQDRMTKIMISAMKQSKQLWLPTLRAPMKSSVFFETYEDQAAKYIAQYRDDNPQLIDVSLTYDEGAIIAIGPEGDFTDDEIEMAERKGFQTVNMGVSRLRTETAAVVALTLLNNKML